MVKYKTLTILYSFPVIEMKINFSINTKHLKKWDIVYFISWSSIQEGIVDSIEIWIKDSTLLLDNTKVEKNIKLDAKIFVNIEYWGYHKAYVEIERVFKDKYELLSKRIIPYKPKEENTSL